MSKHMQAVLDELKTHLTPSKMYLSYSLSLGKKKKRKIPKANGHVRKQRENGSSKGIGH
jgi:hypothetical protein